MSMRLSKIALPALPALLLAGLCCGAAAAAAGLDFRVERLDPRFEPPPAALYPLVSEQFLWRSGDNYDHVGVEQHCSRPSVRRTQDCLLLLVRHTDAAGSGRPERSVLDALRLHLGDSPVHAVATWKRSAPGQAGSAQVVAAWSVDASQLRFRDIDPARVHCTRDESRD